MASSSATDSSKTAAELMQEKHEAAEYHRATVSDTTDEEDLDHPPPARQEALSERPNGMSNGVMSAKAAGKQKVQDKPVGIDTASEEAFPVLGGGPKPSAPAPATSWGKKPLSSKVVNGSSPGISRPSSSGASTPASSRGVSTPVSSAGRAQQFGQRPAAFTAPGQASETIEVSPKEIDKDKSMSHVLDDIFKKNHVRVEVQQTGYGENARVRFTARGTAKAIKPALDRISKELTVKQKKVIQIPSNLKSQLIGRGGSNITEQEKKCDVKFQIQEKKEPSLAANGPQTAFVEITGHAGGIRKAENWVNQFVQERQPKADLPQRDIPPQYFPFIATQHEAQVKRWNETNDLKVHIPSFEPPRAFAGSQRAQPAHITISGDHVAAMRAQAELAELFGDLQQRLKTRPHQIERNYHPFVVGERGMSQADFLSETGCVVAMPEDGSEGLLIIGPEDNIENGVNRARELTENIISQDVDMYRAFSKAPGGVDLHSQAFARYLQERRLEEEFRQLHQAEIMFPSQPDDTAFSVFSQANQNTRDARADLMKIVTAHPVERLSLMDVDRLYHPHLPGMCASHLQDQFGVFMVIPHDIDDKLILVYEGESSPEESFRVSRQAPTAGFEEALEQARNHVLSLIGTNVISQRSVEVPKKFHSHVRKVADQSRQPAAPSSFPVHLDFASGPGDTVHLRGHDEDIVEELRKRIIARIQEVQEDEKLRNNKITFEYPQKLKDRLVGRQGAMVIELQKKHDVRIDTNEKDSVQIRGPPRSAESCKAEILDLQKKWANEIVLKIKVDPKYHGVIIGKAGENMRKLRERYSAVHTIRMPPNSRAADSTSDTASEAGSVRPSRDQAPDEIVIIGPQKEASQVKEEIEALYKDSKENSYEATVNVAQGQISSLIGRKGVEIDRLRAETDARIDMPKPNGSTDSSERVPITIRGTKQAVEKAKAEIQKRAKVFDDVVTRTIEIDQKHHGNLLGSGGSNISRIVQEAGGLDAKVVQFPNKASKSNNVTVTGPTAVVDKVIANLKASVTEMENETTESFEVPSEKHSMLIGSGGTTREALEKEYNIRLRIPRRDETSKNIEIRGKAEDVARAKEEILRRVASQAAGETIHVPVALHHEISQNGRLFSLLRGRKVIVDHGGQKRPPKPEAAAPESSTANNDLPLITDPDDNMAFSWNVVKSGGASNGDAGTIPWILSGPAEAVAAAKADIERKLTTASEPKATGYLKLATAAHHRHIIGVKGRQINDMRRQTGCDIRVPREGDNTDIITIIGTEEACEETKDLILEAVRRGTSGSRPESRAKG